PEVVSDEEATLRDKEIEKLMALISMSFKKIYKPTNKNLRTSSITRTRMENVDTQVVQQTGIQCCFNYKEFGHVSRECKKAKWLRDLVNHKEKMLMCKEEEVMIQLSAEQVDWRDDIDDELEDQELEAHYMYMEKIQEVILDATDNSGPIFDTEPLEKKPANDTYLVEIGDLLASLIEQIKLEIDGSKKITKSLESSNKALTEANAFLNSCYNDNLALMLAPETDETIRLAQESRSKLSDLIKPFDYTNLNKLYDTFVPQREKSAEQKYTWTHFLISKDKTPKVLIDFLRLIQRGLQPQVRTVQTDRGTEFLNKTLQRYFSEEGIGHQTSIARTPE
ncbi:integrase, catalytic region, zinc finger, CCHC-type containing protein, partial [Tanacetum coccineum]